MSTYLQYTQGAAVAQVTIKKKYQSPQKSSLLRILQTLSPEPETPWTMEILTGITGRSKDSIRRSLEALKKEGLLTVKTHQRSKKFLICLLAEPQFAALADICRGPQLAALDGEFSCLEMEVIENKSREVEEICLSAEPQFAALAGNCGGSLSDCKEKTNSGFPQGFPQPQNLRHYYVYIYYKQYSVYKHSADKSLVPRRRITTSLPLGLDKQISIQQTKVNTMEDVKAILRIYSLSSNPRKNKFFKGKSVNFLNGKFGEQLHKIIQEYGLEQTESGMNAFLADQYWLENGLPLYPFLKTPWKWIPDQQGENSPETRYTKNRYQGKLDPELAARALAVLMDNTV